MKVAIMGAGAVGGYYGAALADAGVDVKLIARGEHARSMKRNGVAVSSHWREFVAHPQIAESPAEVGGVDLVIHCVKLYSNPETIPAMHPLIGKDTAVLTIQNGIAGGSALAEEFGWSRVLEGATYIEASLAAPGRLVQSGSAARIEFGERDGSYSKRVKRIRDLLDVPGIQPVVSDDVSSTLWQKMTVIGALGTIVTVARASLPEILQLEEGMNTIRTVMEEIVSCGKAHGVKFPHRMVDVKIKETILEAEEFQSSLQADFERGGPLELDGILGAALRLGREAGVPMPASAALVMALQKFKGT